MKTNSMNLKLLSLTLPTLLIASLLTGCGDTSSNPIEKYNGIQGGPVNNDKATVQTIVTPDLFTLNVQGTNEVNSGQFVEGAESTVLFQVTPKSSSITQYTVELTDFSNMNRPTLTAVAGKAGVYALTWLAPVGTIPGGTWGKTFQAQIQVTVKGSTNRLLVGAITTKSVDVVVNRNGAQPTMPGKTDLSKGVDEGVATVFTVDVMDPNSGPKLPEVQITPYLNSNTEAYRADGHKYLEFDDKRAENPERKGNMYRFYYNLLVENLPLDRDRTGREIPAATSVPMCFLMRAISGSGTFSDQQQVCTTARYAAQPPVITFREIPELKAGHEVSISFQMTAPHPLSVVTLNKPSVSLANLSGAKVITCTDETPDKKNSQVCVIKWTPACISKTTNVDVLVKSDATLADKVKSATMTKTLTVLPDLDLCPMPVTIKKGAK